MTQGTVIVSPIPCGTVIAAFKPVHADGVSQVEVDKQEEYEQEQGAHNYFTQAEKPGKEISEGNSQYCVIFDESPLSEAAAEVPHFP